MKKLASMSMLFVFALLTTGSVFASNAVAQEDARKAQIRRGFQVFQEVCAACHGAKRVAASRLSELGIPELEISNFGWAAGSDAPVFASPYSSDAEAFVANNGAIPGDLSELFMLRRNAASYTFDILTSYRVAPALFNDVPRRLTVDKFYNAAFPNKFIAMAPPLIAPGQVSYSDGTRPTVEQMSRDVAVFLHFASVEMRPKE